MSNWQRFWLRPLATFLLVCGSFSLLDQTASRGADPQQQPAPRLSPFGIGSCYINNRSAEDNARWMPQMAEIGLRVHRTPHTDWGALETAEGQWNWKALDEQMLALDGLQFEYGALLVGNPRWNTVDPPGTLPVNNLPGWSNYVSTLAKHLKGKVRRYEVWNEPPNFTGKDQTPADYAKIVIAAYRAAKAVDSRRGEGPLRFHRAASL